LIRRGWRSRAASGRPVPAGRKIQIELVLFVRNLIASNVDDEHPSPPRPLPLWSAADRRRGTVRRPAGRPGAPASRGVDKVQQLWVPTTYN
jgi:hypothetical protein